MTSDWCVICGSDLRGTGAETIQRLTRERDEAVRERDEARAALAKIDAIRDDIIGRQSINWSAHIYPLVKALGEAGYEGAGYDVAHERARQADDAIRELVEALRPFADRPCSSPGPAVALPGPVFVCECPNCKARALVEKYEAK